MEKDLHTLRFTCHKIYIKSSTEAELMAVKDVMPLILWTRYFFEAQGYEVHEDKVFQDNQSAMLLEKMASTLAVTEYAILTFATSL